MNQSFLKYIFNMNAGLRAVVSLYSFWHPSMEHKYFLTLQTLKDRHNTGMTSEAKFSIALLHWGASGSPSQLLLQEVRLSLLLAGIKVANSWLLLYLKVCLCCCIKRTWHPCGCGPGSASVWLCPWCWTEWKRDGRSPWFWNHSVTISSLWHS